MAPRPWGSFSVSKRFLKAPCLVWTRSCCCDLVRCSLGNPMVTAARNMTKHSYDEAVIALNGLQSNALVVQMNRTVADRCQKNVPEATKYLQRAGISLPQLDALSVIHVTGTKGKGSTCAFTERLLHERGIRTGLYTSPHLISVTERIRINGTPIAKPLYAKYFWQVYNALSTAKESANDMPAYFKFLTVLAYKVFLEEKVEVAIVEVGIGGEYDCTNVIRNPVACGITSLGLDHTSLLGTTIESIAWNKAGIIKPGAGVFVVPDIPDAAMTVIRKRAKEKQCGVHVVPPLPAYREASGVPPPAPPPLGLAGDHQHLNASLALQLAQYWTNPASRGPMAAEKPPCEGWALTAPDLRALKNVQWPGRSQVLRLCPRVTMYLDGAHTRDSMKACARWFGGQEAKGGRVCRVLVFNMTGDRDSRDLLSVLLESRFDLAVFCTNIQGREEAISDQTNRNISEESQHERLQEHIRVWTDITSATDITSLPDRLVASGGTSNGANSVLPSNDFNSVKNRDSSINSDISHVSNNGLNINSREVIMNGCEPIINSCEHQESNCDPLEQAKISDIRDSSSVNNLDSSGGHAMVVPYIQDWLAWLRGATKGAPDCLVEAEHVQVLVTGSLHLVGGVLGALEKNSEEDGS